MSTFDQNNTGFGMTKFDSQENKTNNFCKRYRASIIQSRQEIVEIQPMLQPWKDLALTTEAIQQRCPTVDLHMTNNSLDMLVQDFNELTEMQQYFRRNPEAMHEYMKYKTWQGISK